MQVPSGPCPHLACGLGCLHQGLSGPRGRLSPWGGPSRSAGLSLQIIMVRLQRVTFLALHNYLGLTTELFNPVSVPAPTMGPQDSRFCLKGRASRQAGVGSPGAQC